MIGDPSGKTDMRRMMTNEEIDHNAACFQKQMERLIDFSDGKALIYNNADWIRGLNFLDFMREIGVHFSVNTMLRAECYKQRRERGLTFFEMGYMLMQSYDFLMLNRKTGCVLEMGGDDQWSNILGGADLIRRLERKPAYALTTALLTTSEGKKMGKTEKGALWLDPAKTSPYEFYQYWRNVDDQDVENCLALLTFLPMDEVRRLGSLKDSGINEAKKVLAFTLTEQVHGTEEAEKAQKAAEALFGGGSDKSTIPTVVLGPDQLKDGGILVKDLMILAKYVPSRSLAHTMILKDKCIFVNDEQVTDAWMSLPAELFAGDGVIVRKGKKGFCRFKTN